MSKSFCLQCVINSIISKGISTSEQTGSPAQTATPAAVVYDITPSTLCAKEYFSSSSMAIDEREFPPFYEAVFLPSLYQKR